MFRHFVTAPDFPSCGVRSLKLAIEPQPVICRSIAKPLRIEYDGAVYHASSRGSERQQEGQRPKDRPKPQNSTVTVDGKLRIPSAFATARPAGS